MKKAIVLLGIFFIGFVACKKDRKGNLSKVSTGAIMGRSMFKHMCGERYWIKIYDSTAGFTYRDLPPWSGINPDFTNIEDSIPVLVHWRNTGNCGVVIIDDVQRLH